MADLDKLMQTIREEICADGDGSGGERPAAPVAARSQGGTQLEELFKLSDVDFIKAAYHTFLGREVDPTGFSNIKEELRHGLSDRLSILHELSRSEEGRRYGAPIALPARPGHPLRERLDPRKVIYRLLGIRWLVKLGPQLKIAQHGPIKLSALPFVVNDLKRRVGSTELAAEDVRNLTAVQNVLKSRLDKMEAQQLKIAQHGPIKLSALPFVVDDLKRRVGSTELAAEDVRNLTAVQNVLKSRLDKMEARLASADNDFQSSITEHEMGLAKAAAEFAPLHRQISEMGNSTAEHERRLNDHWRYIADQARRLSILINETRRRLPEPLNAEQLRTFDDEGEKQLSALYVTFEDRYRGTREDIMQRQSFYLPYVREAAEASGGAPFLDIGCGRGEFLELLRANGLTARGLDLNAVMVAECRQRGLEATEGSALDFLRELPSDSLGGVTGFHIIEHVPFGVVIELFDEVLRVLAPGGMVIFETPNPANLLVAAERFYMDPTHRNPLPSEMVSFMAEARGFVRVNVLPLHPVSAQRRSYDDPMLALLQDKLYGPQDYGLIAWKAK